MFRPVRPSLNRASGEVHEREIGRVLRVTRFEGAAPVADRLVLLGFVNRSGSNLLGEYLRSLPGLHGFQESLNHEVVAKRCERRGIDSFPDYIRGLIDAAGGDGLGLKASGAQIEMLHKWKILCMFGSVRGIHVVRQDIVAQAVSLWIARHTKQWKSTRASVVSEREVPFDLAEIVRITEAITRQNARVATAFSAIGIPWQTVVYERLIEQPEPEIARLASFLDLDLHGWEMPRQLGIERQISPMKDAFVARVRAQLASDWSSRDDGPHAGGAWSRKA